MIALAPVTASAAEIEPTAAGAFPVVAPAIMPTTVSASSTAFAAVRPCGFSKVIQFEEPEKFFESGRIYHRNCSSIAHSVTFDLAARPDPPCRVVTAYATIERYYESLVAVGYPRGSYSC